MRAVGVDVTFLAFVYSERQNSRAREKANQGYQKLGAQNKFEMIGIKKRGTVSTEITILNCVLRGTKKA